MKNFGFPSCEHLKKQKDISELFNNGKPIYGNFIKTVFVKSDTVLLNRVAVSVAKRNFKKAVDRNRIKRLIRESYRLNKTIISKLAGLDIMIIYTGKEIPTFLYISSEVCKCLKKIAVSFENKEILT